MGYLTKAQNYFRTSALIGLSLLCSGCGSESTQKFSEIVKSNNELKVSNDELSQKISKLEERVKEIGNELTKRSNEISEYKKNISDPTPINKSYDERSLPEKWNEAYEFLRIDDHERKDYENFSIKDFDRKRLLKIVNCFPQMDINNLTELDKLIIFRLKDFDKIITINSN